MRAWSSISAAVLVAAPAVFTGLSVGGELPQQQPSLAPQVEDATNRAKSLMAMHGFHHVSGIDEQRYAREVRDPDTQVVVERRLDYRTAKPAARDVETYFKLDDAPAVLKSLFGEPTATPFGPAWLFAFSDLPHTGFAVSADGSWVGVREWTVATWRLWTSREAEPTTREFIMLLRRLCGPN